LHLPHHDRGQAECENCRAPPNSWSTHAFAQFRCYHDVGAEGESDVQSRDAGDGSSPLHVARPLLQATAMHPPRAAMLAGLVLGVAGEEPWLP